MAMFTPIFGEVADKEPTLSIVWCLAGVFCIVAFALARIRGWGVVLALLIAAFSGFVTYEWLSDPYEGPAILRELGRGYVTQAYIAGFIPCLFVLLGFLLPKRRHEAA